MKKIRICLSCKLHSLGMVIPSSLSVASLYAAYLRRCFVSSGLISQTLQIDNATTIHFWGPKPDLTHTHDKPSLLLIHGFGPEAIWQWRRQAEFFSPLFHLYIPDLIFFGGSHTKSDERSEAFQAACLGTLMEKLGVGKFYVAGTSYGGFVAYLMAERWPERVEKVVIASSGVNMKRRDKEAIIKKAKSEKIEDVMLPATAAQLRTLSKLAIFQRNLDIVPDFLLNDFVNKMYSDKRDEKMQLLREMSNGQNDEPLDLFPLRQDVLIVWGESDEIFPLKLAHELKLQLGGKARLEVIPKASHLPQIERPVKFNHILKDFLCGSSSSL